MATPLPLTPGSPVREVNTIFLIMFYSGAVRIRVAHLGTDMFVSQISKVTWAFLAMAMLGRLDQFVASKGVSFTIAPLGAVCAVLFATPTSPAARKSNMFVAQIACAAFGVLAFSLFGPGWLARGASLAASIGFMIATGTTHPPAASLPLLFIDGAKLHKLHFWYALFPGAVGCLLLCLIQEVVIYSKNNFKF
ncbi:Integral membrane HPP family protein [Rhynchospora pubera]|uniref:Integral membrane HPP family protein n=1 Tax=Rhynchospora pubera TaxID=906938 RepID=A0AAV8DN63_9POAL|nr:Integral membrane HPP family protein [Rhynchospora pubera]